MRKTDRRCSWCNSLADFALTMDTGKEDEATRDLIRNIFVLLENHTCTTFSCQKDHDANFKTPLGCFITTAADYGLYCGTLLLLLLSHKSDWPPSKRKNSPHLDDKDGDTPTDEHPTNTNTTPPAPTQAKEADNFGSMKNALRPYGQKKKNRKEKAKRHLVQGEEEEDDDNENDNMINLND